MLSQDELRSDSQLCHLLRRSILCCDQKVGTLTSYNYKIEGLALEILDRNRILGSHGCLLEEDPGVTFIIRWATSDWKPGTWDWEF